MAGVPRATGFPSLLPPFLAGPWWLGPVWKGREGWVASDSESTRWWGDVRASACRPGPELVGVAYCPDVLDPVSCNVERVYRHDDAVLLDHQAGLAVDRAFQDRQGGRPIGEVDAGARDLSTAPDRSGQGAGKAAAVGTRRGIGVEQADQAVDILSLPCLPELSDDAGLPGCRGRKSLRGADAAAR